MPRQDSANLDLLRTVAVLLVLFHHGLEAVGLRASPLVKAWGLDSVGKFGVQLFFIHTSLVLMMSLARLETTGPALFRRFYVRRMFRIYPLSMLTVILVLLFHVPSYFGLEYHWPGTTVVLSNLFLVQNVVGRFSVTLPLWSLPFEVQMYLLLPILYLIGKKLRNPLAMVFLGLVLWQVEKRLSLMLGYPRLMDYAPWFFLGIAAYFHNRPARLPAYGFCIGLAGIVGAHLVCARIIGDLRAGWAEWVVCLGFALLLPLFRDLTWTPIKVVAQTIAKYSYGIYVAHLTIMLFVFRQFPGLPAVVLFAIFTILLVPVAYLLFRFVEEPFIRMGGRVANRIGHRPAVTPMVSAAKVAVMPSSAGE